MKRKHREPFPLCCFRCCLLWLCCLDDGEGDVTMFENMSKRLDAEIVRTFGMTSNTIEESPPLTAAMVLAQLREVDAITLPPQIIYTATALEMTPERLFPESRYRSKRIHKKLVKRFGGEFRMRPAAWKIGNLIYVHPSLRGHLEAAIDAAT